MDTYKKEFDSSWYDEVYKKGGHKKTYFQKPKDTIYYPIWVELLSYLDKESKVFELGCGVGQLAQLMIESNIHYVGGLDFSIEAINQAKSILPKINFINENIYSIDLSSQPEYNTIVCCEVFEHIQDDLLVLKNIPSGKNVIFTVPNFDSKSHLRHFDSSTSIENRYKSYLDISLIHYFAVGDKGNGIFLIKSKKV